MIGSAGEVTGSAGYPCCSGGGVRLASLYFRRPLETGLEALSLCS